ncbi:hypothetical protein EYF80_058365 [Liparis tanakae]|uniref:Uncharacterized protein n=1 Tax=Liparis tanakae TaxID=230148 RepID=A0A4Z2ESA9_9TELE|nr:hypothetical protein EYF80_058365 [Liparis tanakae]
MLFFSEEDELLPLWAVPDGSHGRVNRSAGFLRLPKQPSVTTAADLHGDHRPPVTDSAHRSSLNTWPQATRRVGPPVMLLVA